MARCAAALEIQKGKFKNQNSAKPLPLMFSAVKDFLAKAQKR
jgi:hypothetical protein